MDEVIDRRFRVIERIGGGKTSDVYLVEVVAECGYATLGQKLAIKKYKPWVLEEPSQEKRIWRELQASQNLNSKNIVHSYEVISANETFYLVMEYFPAVTLTSWMEQNPKPSANDLIRIASGIAQGLLEFHAHHLVHRDIKPDNIMLNETDIKIMDLGVVSEIEHLGSLSMDKFLGTISYTAPEYLMGDKYGFEADTFSFGLVLYEAMFGKHYDYPNEHWVQQIVARVSTGSFDDQVVSEELIDRIGFRLVRFLVCILQGTLEFEPEKRLSIEKIAATLQQRIWEGTFLHRADPSWPEVPDALEQAVLAFEEHKLSLDRKTIGDCLKLATHGDTTNTVSCYQDSEEEIQKITYMHSLGLLYEPQENESYELEAQLTPLAWQLLLRGCFNGDKPG